MVDQLGRLSRTPAAVAAGVIGVGSFVVVFVVALVLAALPDRSEGVAVDGEGRVIVADSGRDRVLRFVPAGDGYQLEDTLTGFTTPLGVAAGASGSVYVADTYANRVKRFGPPPPVTAPPVTTPAAAAPVAAVQAGSARTRPLGLVLRVTPRRDRRRPYRFQVSGRLRRAAGVSAATGCRGRVDVRLGSTRRAVALRRDCNFGVTLRGSRRGSVRVRVRVTFTGNATLAPLAARSVRVRAGYASVGTATGGRAASSNRSSSALSPALRAATR